MKPECPRDDDMRLHDSWPWRLRRARNPTILLAVVLIGILVVQASWGEAESVRWEDFEHSPDPRRR